VPNETREGSTDTAALEPQEELDTRDRIIAEAALHVKQACDQRRLCNSKIKEAEDDLAANKSFEDSHQIIICDFGQNIGCPQAGESQCGDTYYMVALNVFIFGIVNTAIPGGVLDAWVYHEGQGKKGGNNVTTLLMMDLKKRDGCERTRPEKN